MTRETISQKELQDKIIEEGVMEQIGRYMLLSPVIFQRRFPMKRKALLSMQNNLILPCISTIELTPLEGDKLRDTRPSAKAAR
jgi:hypothetical protein